MFNSLSKNSNLIGGLTKSKYVTDKVGQKLQSNPNMDLPSSISSSVIEKISVVENIDSILDGDKDKNRWLDSITTTTKLYKNKDSSTTTSPSTLDQNK